MVPAIARLLYLFVNMCMEVDCSADGKETCRRNGVKGYPTLKVFRHGQFEADYAGPRHAGYLKLDHLFSCNDFPLKS